MLQKVVLEGAGVPIAADIGGPDDGVPVVLLHGGGQTRHSWGQTTRRLAATGHRVCSVDLRGHGESGWAADGDYRLDRFVEDLSAVMAMLERPAFVVGASMGGMAGLLTVGEGHAEAAGLLLVDIAPRMEIDGAMQVGAFMTGNSQGFASVEEASDAVAAYRPGKPRPKDPNRLLKNLRLGNNDRYYWHWDPAFMARAANAGDLETMTRRLQAAAGSLTVPAALIRGGLSNIVSAEGAEEFRELVPHAEVVVIESADHMVAGDRNDRFSDAVIDFLLRNAH